MTAKTPPSVISQEELNAIYKVQRTAIRNAIVNGPLKMLAGAAQFINCKLEPQDNGKMGKIPVNPSGHPVNAHDPANWMTADEALSCGELFDLGVGFVFTDTNPLVFIDIDHCIVDKIISPFAHEILAMFPGAYVEVSQSGTGLHIFATYTGEAPPHKNKHSNADKTICVEVYTHGRFVALTGTDAYGDSGADCTEGLYRIIDLYLKRAESEILHGEGNMQNRWVNLIKDPNWEGPTDDDELVMRALKSSSGHAIFGNGVSFRDLYEADEDKLATAYPSISSDEPYDRSRADMALACRLAFWTGNDVERIERIMLRSALRREKWEIRPVNYFRATILQACEKQKEVLGGKKKQEANTPTIDAVGDDSHKSATTTSILASFDATKQSSDLGWMECSIADLFSKPPQPPQFLIDEILSAHVVTLLSAHGGVGKSQLALQAAVCLALGLPFMGKPTRQSRVLFYSAEDSQDILRFRLATICRSLNIDPKDLAKNLMILDATQTPCLWLLGTDRRADTTPGYSELKARLSGFDVVIIDNASDTFDANENDRGQVRGFIRTLRQLNVTVLLLAHIAKQTARNREDDQEGYSGSTAWHNSARSRLLLTRECLLLKLTHQKSNYGKRSDDIYMTWLDNGIILHMPNGKPTPADDPETSNALLQLVTDCNKCGVYLSSRRGGGMPTKIFNLLKSMPGFPETTIRTSEQLIAHFDYLLDKERLVIESYQNEYRKRRERYAVRPDVNPATPPLCDTQVAIDKRDSADE